MKKLLPVLLLFVSCQSRQQQKKIEPNKAESSSRDSSFAKSIADSTNRLTGKTEKLELEYIVWGCACANWITPSDHNKYQDSGLTKHCIFIEPANDSLAVPVYFDPKRHRIKVKGQFYVKPDYPKGTIKSEEGLEKAMVFSYNEIEVLKSIPASKY